MSAGAPASPTRRLVLAGAALAALPPRASARGFDHGYSQLDALLRRQVAWGPAGVSSTVSYRGLAAERNELRKVLDDFASVTMPEYEAFRRDEKLAFLINAYNAFTLELVLTKYPDLKSIKDLGSLVQSPWKRRFFRLLGDERHLDWVEHEMIRAPGAFDEPRIHFAVVCASVGCPALRPEAFVAARLEQQLEDSTRRFLRDRSRNRYNPRAGRLEVSKLFDWYRADFERSPRGAGSREAFLGRYADLLADEPKDQQLVREGRLPIVYLDYDWSLNDRR
jgi:hypothetical protein